MKATILTAVVLACATFMSNAKTNETENSITEFGSYELSAIKSESPLVVEKTKGEYTIHYSDIKAPVRVTVVKENNCKLYLVRTWGYELQYIYNRGEFGVQLMNKKYAKIPYNEILAKIDKEAFRYQRIITMNRLSDEEYVRLIACFLPDVLD